MNTPESADLWEAVARYLAGESDPAETERVERWLAENPSVRDTLAAIEVARERLSDRAASGIDVEAALLRARARLREDEAAAGEGSSASPDEAPREPRSRGR